MFSHSVYKLVCCDIEYWYKLVVRLTIIISLGMNEWNCPYVRAYNKPDTTLAISTSSCASCHYIG